MPGPRPASPSSAHPISARPARVPLARVVAALRPHDVIGLQTHGLTEISVTRESRAIALEDIEMRIARALAGKHGLGEAKDLTVTLERRRAQLSRRSDGDRRSRHRAAGLRPPQPAFRRADRNSRQRRRAEKAVALHRHRRRYGGNRRPRALARARRRGARGRYRDREASAQRSRRRRRARSAIHRRHGRAPRDRAPARSCATAT